VGQENLTWDQMLSRLAAADGRQVRVIHLPAALITLGGATLWGLHQLQGVEHGLDARHIAAIQTAETYLDPAVAREAFGLPEDDLDEAFRETVRACQD